MPRIPHDAECVEFSDPLGRELALPAIRPPASDPPSELEAVVGHDIRTYAEASVGIPVLLDATEAANGFGNRFLWFAVHRSKVLPEGGNLDRDVLDGYGQELDAVVRKARRQGSVVRDQSARELWRNVYPDLSSDAPGLFGALTARAEAQVVRLSLLYALLDGADAISEPHLRAALALWDYSRRSVAFLFGDATGNPDADAILRALRASPDGHTRTDISNLFGRNISAARIERALLLLHDVGIARMCKEPTQGRPAERWVAVTKETREANERSAPGRGHPITTKGGN